MTAVENDPVDREGRLQAVVDGLRVAGGEWHLSRVVKIRPRPVRFRLCGAFRHSCDRCGRIHVTGGDVNVAGADIRNPNRLGVLARGLGAALTERWTAADGRELMRALYRAAEVDQ